MKQNISNKSNNTEQLSPVLEKLRIEAQCFKVPEGYFDSLSPRIMDRIKKQENNSFIKILVPLLKKPLVWAPAVASVAVVLFLVFAVPSKKASIPQVTGEWTEIYMSYDASYAEEALLDESNIIDNELDNSDTRYIATALITNEMNQQLMKLLSI